MVFRKPLLHVFSLTLGLLGAGCAELTAWREPSAKPAATANADRPPVPAPALYIASSPIELTSAMQPRTALSQKPALATPVGATDVLDNLPALVPASNIPVAPEAPSELSTASLRSLHRKAAARYAKFPDYAAQLRRREFVAGKHRPEEIIACKFRKDPWSVSFRWIGEEAHGRQAVYMKGQSPDVLHLLTAGGDKFLAPSAQRMQLPLDSAWLKANNRHPLTKAGIGALIERFGQLVDQEERSAAAAAKLKDLGVLKRPELALPVHAIMQTIPPRSEELLPKGGQRLWFFDTLQHLPVLIITHDDTGREVEYYCYQEIQPMPFTHDDFDPHVLSPR